MHSEENIEKHKKYNDHNPEIIIINFEQTFSLQLALKFYLKSNKKHRSIYSLYFYTYKL